MSKKRKYQEEHREFKIQWEEDFFFIERNSKPFCLICQSQISQFKVSNLKRHYETNHSSLSNKFPTGSDLRKNKLSTMKSKLNKQTNVMTVFSTETDITTEVSFCMAFNIARAKRPYTDGVYFTKNHFRCYFHFKTGR